MPADDAERFGGRETLYERPGFLIRRANQIAVWLFLDEAAPMVITPAQYGALLILRACAATDQIGLSKLLRLDKSTTALVVSKLEAAGYLRRENDARDKRRRMLRITEAGLQALRDLAPAAERARGRLLSALADEPEREVFLHLLGRYVMAHGASVSRACPVAHAAGTVPS